MQEVQLILSPEQAFDNDYIKRKISEKIGATINDISGFKIVKKSIDARSRFPLVILQLRAFVNEQPEYKYENTFNYRDVSKKEEVVIVGAGPAGLFAALRLIELGFCPIILERGKNVHERKIDIANISRNKELNEDSNFCYGEGGAGTFSDGKLYSRSTKRGNIRRIIEIFHYHGAQDEILYEAQPHIGTDRLPVVVSNISKTITDCGGKLLFNSKVVDILIDKDRVTGVKLADNLIIRSKNVILAAGHSAKDIYEILQAKNIALQAKGFAVGVRVEHSQDFINDVQYKGNKSRFLPSASYSLTTQINGRGVYSFCMCPGGIIVPSATEHNHIVINGMSSSTRNSPFANAGIVVELHPEDLKDFHKYGEMCGLYFQRNLENLAFVNNGGNNQQAPAQRLDDFVKGKLSTSLPKCSYLPGVISSPMHFWLPDLISKRLQEGFKDFNKKIKGFVTSDALVAGVETRTSSPVRIPRNDNLQHIQIKGLYPCGEGAGYSGGITSSAIDGERAAEQIKLTVMN